MSFSFQILYRWLRQVLASPHLMASLAYLALDPFPGSLLSKVIWVVVTFDLFHKWVTIPEPIKNDPGRWKVVIVGAGVSGLCMAKRLKDVGVQDFVILEKSSKLGGTWNDNLYPGVACDIMSHFYSYSFHYNPWWSRSFSEGKEIWNYLYNFATSYDLHGCIEYNTTVVKADWNNDNKQWTVFTKEGKQIKGNVLISAAGALCVPHIPTFKDQDSFKKPIVHTRLWDPSLDLSGKKVGIIGTGASAVQIVPKLAEKVDTLHVFQRTPAWSPIRRDFAYWPWLQTAFRCVPWLITIYRYVTFWVGEIVFHLLFKTEAFTHPIIKDYLASDMKKALNNDETLSKALIPQYEPGCKRITPSDTYLKAFTKSNVHLIQDKISCFTPEGIKLEDGKVFDLDVIILATGFDMLANARPFQTFGVNKEKSEEERWGDEPRAYLGITDAGYPNKFYLLGPGTGLGHSSVLYMIECQVNYVLDCLRTLDSLDKSSMDVKPHVLNDYIRYVDDRMTGRSFGGSCNAWYKNDRGVNWTLWPEDLIKYWYCTYSCSQDDFNFY